MQFTTNAVKTALSRRRLLSFAMKGSAGAAGLLGLAAISGCASVPGHRQSPPSMRAARTAAPSAAPSVTPEPVWTAGLSKEQALATYGRHSPGSFGLQVPGIQLGLPAGAKGVALTFDACGGRHGSKMDQKLIEILRAHRAPATLFVNQRWAISNPGLLTELIADPLFDIANHGTTHAPLSISGQRAYGIRGTGSVTQAYDEIVGNQRYLAQEFGVAARFFRSGTAHMDQTSAALCRKLGLVPMNFTVNMDAGATFPAATVAAQVSTMVAGDVGIGHFNQPDSGTAAGVRLGLDRLSDAGINVVRLAAP